MEDNVMTITQVTLDADKLAEQAATVFEEKPGFTKGEKIVALACGGFAVGVLVVKAVKTLTKAIPTWSTNAAIKTLEKKGYQIYAPVSEDENEKPDEDVEDVESETEE